MAAIQRRQSVVHPLLLRVKRHRTNFRLLRHPFVRGAQHLLVVLLHQLLLLQRRDHRRGHRTEVAQLLERGGADILQQPQHRLLLLGAFERLHAFGQILLHTRAQAYHPHRRVADQPARAVKTDQQAGIDQPLQQRAVILQTVPVQQPVAGNPLGGALHGLPQRLFHRRKPFYSRSGRRCLRPVPRLDAHIQTGRSMARTASNTVQKMRSRSHAQTQPFVIQQRLRVQHRQQRFTRETSAVSASSMTMP